ncbi:MAG: hypothetical protein ACRYFX_15970 [Janthinobacterium lividum]
MKLLLLLLASCLTLATAQAQTPSWQVATAGSTTQASGPSQTMATAIDASGNVFVTGYFAGSVTFGGTTLTSAGGNDLFVAKWVPGASLGTGSWTWAQRGGGTGDDQGLGIAVSSTSVYVTGYLTNTTANAAGVTLGSTAVAGATSTSSSDLVLVRYTDNGTSATLDWTQVGGGTEADQGRGVAVRGTNVYATGFITNNSANISAVVFGSPGATMAQYGAGTGNASSSDLVVAKYTDNGTSATLGWTQVGGGVNTDLGQAIAVGSNGVYVTGSILNSGDNGSGVRFGGSGTTLGTRQQNGVGTTSSLSNDLLVVKYTDNGTTGTYGWSQVGGGTDADAGQGIAVGSDNATVYVTGYIKNNLNNTKKVLFGGSGTTPGTTMQYGATTSTTGADMVVAKYIDNGTSATFGWTQVGGGRDDDQGQAISVNGNDLYVTGYVTNNTANDNSVVFGGSGTTAGKVSQSGAASGTASADIIVASYTDNSTSATLNWTQIGGGTGTDRGQGISLSGSTIYVVGSVVPTATFGSLSVNNPAGSTVNFLGQLAVSTQRAAAPLPVVLTAFTATPVTGGWAVRVAWATASETNSARFEVERSSDGVSFAAFRTVAAAGSSPTSHSYILIDAALPAGARLLYYRLRQVDVDGTPSYSSVRVVAVGLASPVVLFPNPARAATTLAGAEPGAVMQVLDALGHLVAMATADATGTARLPLPAGLAPGVYVVRAGGQVARLAVE